VISIRDRRAWLRRFGDTLGRHVDELCTLVSSELGKSEWEVLSTELMPLVASVKWHRRSLRRALRPRTLRGGAIWQLSQRHRLHRVPKGTVGIIATWNYPLQLLGIQLVQAIAAGNRVVVKPSEQAPRSQLRLLELARDAGLDGDRLRWTEATREAGAQLLEEPLDHVIFTGSTEVGRIVARTCADRLISSTLELSGRDSALVLADADPELAARSIWNGVVMNAGQTCMAPRRVLVDHSVSVRFTDELARLSKCTEPVRMVRPEEVSHCLRLVRDAEAAGGRSLADHAEPVDERTIRPTAVVDSPPDCELSAGRHFGPVLAVTSCQDLDEMLELHGACGQKLATSVYARSREQVGQLTEVLGSGVVTFNDTVVPTGHPAAPITGRGESGWGASRGLEGLLELTRPVVVSRTGSFMRLPTDQPGPKIQEFLRRMMRRGPRRG
jgi:acyl-CoA reductase-like NAD-dependent aldehyde dehydrogenase